MLKELERPEIQKYYTTNEIAVLLNTTPATIRSIAHYHNLEYKIVATTKSRQAMFTYDSYRLIKEVHENGRAKSVRLVKELKEKQLEEECTAELHPLVKDKRWLSTKNWPDITPKSFEDLED